MTESEITGIQELAGHRVGQSAAFGGADVMDQVREDRLGEPGYMLRGPGVTPAAKRTRDGNATVFGGLVILLYRSRSRRGTGGGEKGSRQAVPV